MEMKECLLALLSTPTVTGFEERGRENVKSVMLSAAGGFLTEDETTPAGSLLLWHRVRDGNAGTILLDAHMDTVGFAVSEHKGGGFVKVTGLGGIDPYILPSSAVTLYGKQTVRGVFTSVPPHLLSDKDNKDGLKLENLYVDTGLSDEKVKEWLPVGTPVGFAEKPVFLRNNVICSPGLDDKACAAMLAESCRLLAESGREVPVNVCVCLSAGEEKTQSGAATLPYVTHADACLVTDVNFALCDGVKPYESFRMGEGCGISYSSTTSRPFTDFVADTASKAGIPLQTVVETKSTGTNATFIHRAGLPCAVLSVPLRNMHTDCECASLSDMAHGAALIAETVSRFDECTGIKERVIKA